MCDVMCVDVMFVVVFDVGMVYLDVVIDVVCVIDDEMCELLIEIGDL